MTLVIAWRTTKLIEGGHRDLQAYRRRCYYFYVFYVFSRFFKIQKKRDFLRFFCRVSYVFSNFGSCLSVSVYAQRTGQSDQFKTVKTTDFKFDLRVPRDSPDMTPYFFRKGSVCKNSVGGDMHSDERLKIANAFLSIIK